MDQMFAKFFRYIPGLRNRAIRPVNNWIPKIKFKLSGKSFAL